MKTMKLLTVFLATTFTTASLTYAGNLSFKQSTSLARVGGTSGVGGGGDDVGLDFQASAGRALSNLKSDLIDPSTRRQALEMMQSAQYLVSETPLKVVENDGSTQNPVAVNIPAKKVIYIDAKKWKALGNEEVRQSLALHEILSLLGLEKNGDYSISSQFKNSQMGSAVLKTANSVVGMSLAGVEKYQQKLFAQIRAPNSGRTPYEILKELYDTAPVGARASDLPTCQELAAAKNNKYFYVTSPRAELGMTREEFIEQAQYLKSQYIVRVDVEWVTAGTASAGPLFPGTSGSVENWGDIVYTDSKNAPSCTSRIPALKFWTIGDKTGSSLQPGIERVSGQMLETKSDLVFASYLTFKANIRDRHKLGVPSADIKKYIRRSGNLIVTKVTQSLGSRDEVVGYAYGWKE